MSDALCQHIDVFGTILDLVGIEPEWVHFGQSLMPILEGHAEMIRDAVFGESGYNHPHEIPWCIARLKLPEMAESSPYYPFCHVFREVPEAAERAATVRDRYWKYVWRQAEHDELYDLQTDPQERHNLLGGELSAEASAHANRLRQRLLSWHIETGDVMPIGVRT